MTNRAVPTVRARTRPVQKVVTTVRSTKARVMKCTVHTGNSRAAFIQPVVNARTTVEREAAVAQYAAAYKLLPPRAAGAASERQDAWRQRHQPARVRRSAAPGAAAQRNNGTTQWSDPSAARGNAKAQDASEYRSRERGKLQMLRNAARTNHDEGPQRAELQTLFSFSMRGKGTRHTEEAKIQQACDKNQ